MCSEIAASTISPFCPVAPRDDLSKLKAIQIAPGIYLLKQTTPHGDESRLAERFRHTWNTLPENVQRKMAEHWSKTNLVRPPNVGSSATLKTTAWAPMVQVKSEWLDKNMPGVAAHTGFEGNLIEFSGPILDRLPDRLRDVVIAHELAHVWQFANDTRVAN